MAQITEDLQYTRIIYRFPFPGNHTNPYGPPVRIITETFNSIGDSGPENSRRNGDYIVVPASSYVSRSIGMTEFSYLLGGYTEWQDITATVGGAERKYVGFKQTLGTVTPAQVSVIRQIVEGVGDAAEALKNKGKELLLYILSIISMDLGVRNLINQPFPSHHTGMIRMQGNLRGVAGEGGAIDGNSVTMASVNVNWTQEIMTADYHEFMKARRIWNSFMQLSSGERREQLRLFQTYLAQRNELLEKRRRGQLQVGDAFPPSPLTDDTVHPYIWWAWQRRLDPTAPPPDTRRFTYPGYDYSVKRSWWIAPTNGLPTE